jgi:hypothetical protein
MTEDEKLVNTVAKELYKRLGNDSIFTLPWASQIVTVVVALQGVTDNGGFIYFFENDWPGNPPYSVFAEAFLAIGAEETADCIVVAASQFPFNEPHLHCKERKEYLRNHCMIGDRENNSATLVKLGDRVIDNGKANYALLAKYIREHMHEIRSGN